MSQGRIILTKERFARTIDRICHELIEQYDDFSNVCIIGIQSRGVLLAERIYNRLRQKWGVEAFEFGKLDITFYRDDFRRRQSPLAASNTEMDFLVENKRVILVDDVLYTGRTIQAAMTALGHYGRPVDVELVTMVDRRFNRHLPIQADFTGITIDALDQAYVKVYWQATDGKDEIQIFEKSE